MAEQLTIYSGYSGYGYDPARDHMDEAIMAVDQDLYVIERCPEVLRHASNLICRLAGSYTLLDSTPSNFIQIKTPPVGYMITDDKKSREGSVWLESLYQSPQEDEVAIDFHATEITLMAGSPTASDKWLLRLTHDSIERNAFGERRLAGHVELNYMTGIVSKIREKVFPKDKKLAEEKRLDKEADRRARQAASN